MMFKPSDKCDREEWEVFQRVAAQRQAIERRYVSAWEVAVETGAITEEDERNSWS